MASSSRNVTSQSTSPSYRHSRVADAIQVAPYLTHIVTHHGQVTLIPPENTARIRKPKKKRPAIQTHNSSASLDLPRTSASRSRPNTPRPHSSTSIRSTLPTANGSVSELVMVTRTSQNQRDICIPDFPPPSFEEAMLAAPSPNNAISGSPVHEPATESTISERAAVQELTFVSNTHAASPSPLPPSSDVESEHSETSHSSLEESAETGLRSLWEQDREAGYSLDERVQRELERRRLADSLPRAPVSHVLEHYDACLEDSQMHSTADDVPLAVQQKHRAHRIRAKSRQEVTSADIFREGETSMSVANPISSSSSGAEGKLGANSGLSTSDDSDSHVISRKGKGKEKEVPCSNEHSLCNFSFHPPPGRGSSESSLSRIREAMNRPLRPHANVSAANSISTSASTSQYSLISDDSRLIAQSLGPPFSHNTSTLHSVSSSSPSSTSTSASTDVVSLPFQPSMEPPSLVQPVASFSSTVTLSSSCTTSLQASSTNRPLPTRPVVPLSTLEQRPPLSVRRPLPSTPSKGIPVRDRISAFEALQNRPVPSPPPMRPVVRRPPPPVPGPSNFDCARRTFGTRIEDISYISVGSDQQRDKDDTSLPSRRKLPPSVPPRRRPVSSAARLEQSHSILTASSSSSPPGRLDERDVSVSPTIPNIPADPAMPVITVQSEDRDEQLATSIVVRQPVSVLQGDIAEHNVSAEGPPETVAAPIIRPDYSSLAAEGASGSVNHVGIDKRARGSSPTTVVTEEQPQTFIRLDLQSDVREDETSDNIPNARQNLPSQSSTALLESTPGRTDGSFADRHDAADEAVGRSSTVRRIEGNSTVAQVLRPLQPMFTGLTDLDLLLARLDDPDFTFNGRSYDDLLLLEEIMGPAFGADRQNDRIKFEDIPLGRIEVLRRRVTKDGRTKLKLALLGVVVDKCGICLVQFKDGVFACLLPCRHAFHENCLRLWMRRGETCPLCRGPLSV